MHCLRVSFLITIAGVLLSASLLGSSVTYSVQDFPSGTQYRCIGTQGVVCDPFDFYVPQFNPSLGTLDSVTWSFTDNQTYYLSTDEDTNGDPFTFSTTETDTSTLLGLNVSNTQIYSGITLGPAYQGEGFYGDTLEATGSAPNLTPFIATGLATCAPDYLCLPATPSFTSTLPAGGEEFLVTGEIGFPDDYATLTLTYNYTAAAIPEPASIVVIPLVVLLMAFCFKRKGWLAASV